MMDSNLAFLFPDAEADSPAGPSSNIRFLLGSGNSGVVVFDSHTSQDWRSELTIRGVLGVSGTSILPPVDRRQEDFLRGKRFFETLTPAVLNAYAGKHIAIHGQRIVDSDPDLYALTNRFFSTYGDVPVYITFIGMRPRSFIPGPIR